MNNQTPKIAILDSGYRNYNFENDMLSSAGFELKIYEGDSSDLEAKIEFASDTMGIFVRWTKVGEIFLSRCPLLKAIVRYGAGYENIDIDAASRFNVKVANVGGYGNHSVSDHALSLIYAGIRGLFPGTASFSEIYGKAPFPKMFELHRKTLGIIGLGRIGGTLAGKAKGLFHRVLASDPYIPDSRFLEVDAEKVNLESLLRQSDVISIHCNLTEETRSLIDGEAFTLMEQKPFLINTARGQVIESEALLHALENDLVSGAGLDVFDSEIPAEIDNRILMHPRIIATGHYAWYSENSLDDLQRRAAGNMIALLNDQSIEDGLN